jgi:carboxyl-terminal processing protease
MSRLPLLFILLTGCVPPRVDTAHDSPFDARAAFDEFEETLRAYYAYIDRVDFDVDAHLARTRAAAERAVDRRALRRILHRSTFAFTDPHFLVAPLDDDDPNVWATSSDLFVEARGDAFVVGDVRAGAAADVAGIRPGWTVLSVDGLPLDERISEIWAGLIPAPTQKQTTYAATLAVNGIRVGTRSIEFGDLSLVSAERDAAGSDPAMHAALRWLN